MDLESRVVNRNWTLSSISSGQKWFQVFKNIIPQNIGNSPCHLVSPHSTNTTRHWSSQKVPHFQVLCIKYHPSSNISKVWNLMNKFFLVLKTYGKDFIQVKTSDISAYSAEFPFRCKLDYMPDNFVLLFKVNYKIELSIKNSCKTPDVFVLFDYLWKLVYFPFVFFSLFSEVPQPPLQIRPIFLKIKRWTECRFICKG